MYSEQIRWFKNQQEKGNTERTSLGFHEGFFPWFCAWTRRWGETEREETRTSECQTRVSDYALTKTTLSCWPLPSFHCVRPFTGPGVCVCAHTTHQTRRQRTNIYTCRNQKIVYSFFFLLPGWRSRHPKLLLVNISGCWTRVTESTRTTAHPAPSKHLL